MSNLSPVQFKDYTLSHELDDDGHHVITATDKSGKNAGFLDWYHTGGEIHDVGVQDDHQRRGVATAMYSHAKELNKSNKSIPVPVHAANRTPEGDAWARSVGGPGLNKKACTACGDDGHLAGDHT